MSRLGQLSSNPERQLVAAARVVEPDAQVLAYATGVRRNIGSQKFVLLIAAVIVIAGLLFSITHIGRFQIPGALLVFWLVFGLSGQRVGIAVTPDGLVFMRLRTLDGLPNSVTGSSVPLAALTNSSVGGGHKRRVRLRVGQLTVRLKRGDYDRLVMAIESSPRQKSPVD